MTGTNGIDMWWGPGPDESVEGLDVEQMDVLLDQLDEAAKARPILVDVTVPSGDLMTIGVGAPVTVLLFMPDGRDWESVAEEPLITGTVWFDMAGAESEFVPEQVISSSAGRNVLRTFVTSGDRSGVAWIES